MIERMYGCMSTWLQGFVIFHFTSTFTKTHTIIQSYNHATAKSKKILNKYFIPITFLVIILSTPSFSQVVYTPSDHYIYEFLERLSLKKVIEHGKPTGGFLEF
jgi:hypothetical protein